MTTTQLQTLMNHQRQQLEVSEKLKNSLGNHNEAIRLLNRHQELLLTGQLQILEFLKRLVVLQLIDTDPDSEIPLKLLLDDLESSMERPDPLPEGGTGESSNN